MKKSTLFKLFLVLTLLVVGVGFYRGWFVLSSQRNTDNGRVDVKLTVNPDKAKDDARAVDAKARSAVAKDASEESPEKRELPKDH